MPDYDYTDVNTGEDFTDDQMEDIFQDNLDEVYGEVDIAGYSMSTGRVLREVDYTAFREEFNNWIDNEITEGNFREYVEPVCDACDATLTQDDVTEVLSVYGKMLCPSCVDDEDEDCEICGLPGEDCTDE